jgi:uncharacterized membrane protein
VRITPKIIAIIIIIIIIPQIIIIIVIIIMMLMIRRSGITSTVVTGPHDPTLAGVSLQDLVRQSGDSQCP